jgi:lipid-binding SYLF domain-containing protein
MSELRVFFLDGFGELSPDVPPVMQPKTVAWRSPGVPRAGASCRSIPSQSWPLVWARLAPHDNMATARDIPPMKVRDMNVFRTLTAILLFLQAMVAVPAKTEAASAAEIDAGVGATLNSFQRQFPGARELGQKAAGVLVFPSVVKAGFGFGGEYGEGLLIIRGRPGGYYNLISGSFGFQLGVQVRSVIIMFMTERALASFESTYGWKVGVDGSVAIVTLGAGGSIDTESLTSPVIGFILDPTGLMYNLTLEGSKISRISR